MTIHLLSTRQLTPKQLATLYAVAPDAEITHFWAQSGTEIEQALTPSTEVLFTGRGDYSIAHAQSLRWVQMENAGIDHIHNTALWHSSLPITSANGTHLPHLPEYVLTMLLAWAHRLPALFDLQTRAQWASGQQVEALWPRPVYQRTLGIVGYGAIGREIARMGKAIGMRILATHRPGGSLHYTGYSPAGLGDPAGKLPDAWFTLAELPALLRQSDYVVLGVPLMEHTRHLIDAAALAHMQPHALLINIGRGGLIDQDALLAALQAKQIGGAVLDVTTPEPLPANHPLWRQENVIITPHMAGLVDHHFDNVVDLWAENLRRYRAGEPLHNLVARELGY
ncbi:MAG: D-2-hydroxyacid dehydrogenase [Caldilineaceae bacterium]|nr:D-2-hydroxyacid dehydrogenase [Caldilineaceae bacterium]